MELRKKIKKSVADILYTNPNKKGWLYKFDDYLITSLILINVASILLESFDNIYEKYRLFFSIFEIITVSVFTIEYVLRIWVADIQYRIFSPAVARRKYIFSAMGLIDLIAIIPFFLPIVIAFTPSEVKSLRTLRLFLIFKLAHYSRALRLIAKVISAKKNELGITILSTLILMLISSSLMYEIEKDYQPEQFDNIWSSFWWAVSSLTTIGYGDIVPISPMGRVLASISALFGVGLVAIPTGIISASFLQEVNKEKQKKDNKYKRNFNFRKQIRKPKKMQSKISIAKRKNKQSNNK